MFTKTCKATTSVKVGKPVKPKNGAGGVTLLPPVVDGVLPTAPLTPQQSAEVAAFCKLLAEIILREAK